MPVKQKYTTMRPLLYTSIVLLFLSSCITSSHVHYSDPNYLGSSEFSSYEEIVTEPVSEIYQTQDTDTITDNYYSEYDVADDYYDYSFSSRIRRFHRPMYYSNYYGGLYTDYYWYNNDPFYCGTSIYYGYNWNSPYYSYYSYSPYYYNNYNSYSAYGYSNHQHHTPNYTYYNSNNNNHTTGHRSSLSSHSSGRGVKTNTIIPNTNVNTSTLNIRNGNTLKNNTNSTIRNTSITTKPYRGNTTIKTGNSRGNTSIKTNTTRANTTTKTNNSYRGNTSTKTTTKKGNRSYTAPKSNTNKKSYSAPKSNSNKRNYNSGSSKSNRGSKSSGNSNRRSTKPRK
jgi:hypothetical protein